MGPRSGSHLPSLFRRSARRQAEKRRGDQRHREQKIKDPMRGAPGSLISAARQELRKKRFPRRFSPSARNMDRCTSSSTFRVLDEIVRAAAQVAAFELFLVFFDTYPEHALHAERIQKPIRSDRDSYRFG